MGIEFTSQVNGIWEKYGSKVGRQMQRRIQCIFIDGLASLFNGISTFVGAFNVKAIFVEEPQDII